MRKLSLIFLLICLNITVMAQKYWIVKKVPNTRLESNDIHVSDPDGYLSDSAEMNINTALCAIRDKADVFLVTLTSIGEVESKRFATQLFNYWGIGNAESNNGVLLLFVEDQHALEFETGYGAEETLTDARCQRIFTNTIVPFFRAGDYEGGLCAGVAEIVNIYDGEVPAGLKSNLSSNTGVNDGNGGLKEENMSGFFMFFCFFLFVMPVVGLVFWNKKRKQKTGLSGYQLKTEDNVNYIDGFKPVWSGSPWEGKGCLGGLLIGLSIFVFFFAAYLFVTMKYPDMAEKKQFNWSAVITLLLYFTWICFLQNRRALKTADDLAKKTIRPKEIYKAAFSNTGNKLTMGLAPWLGVFFYNKMKKRVQDAPEFCCPTCGQTMKQDESFHLPEIHELESEVEALRFTPYRCLHGHEFVVTDKGKQFYKFTTCQKCGAYTMKKTKLETIREANYSHSGEQEETCVCQHCGETIINTIVIPKLVHHTSKSSSSSSSSSHSNSSGGSFGGGSSGGGGYSGKW